MVSDYSVSITLSASPNDKLGVRLVQSHTVITRTIDSVIVFDVTEPNDTPDRAKQTARNMVLSIDAFAASRAAFVDGPQDVFPVVDVTPPTPLQVFQQAKGIADRAQAYVAAGVLAVDDPAVVSATQALDDAKKAAAADAATEIQDAATAVLSSAVVAVPPMQTPKT